MSYDTLMIVHAQTCTVSATPPIPHQPPHHPGPSAVHPRPSPSDPIQSPTPPILVASDSHPTPPRPSRIDHILNLLSLLPRMALVKIHQRTDSLLLWENSQGADEQPSLKARLSFLTALARAASWLSLARACNAYGPYGPGLFLCSCEILHPGGTHTQVPPSLSDPLGASPYRRLNPSTHRPHVV